MATKPATQPRWADGGGALITTPSSGAQDVGHVPNTAPAAQLFNWFWNLVYLWIAFFDAQRSDLVTRFGGATADSADGQLTNILQVREETSAFGRLTKITGVLSGGEFPAAFAVAGNGTGTIVCVGTGGKISSSANGGKSWTSRTAGSAFAGAFNSVIWTSLGGGLFVATGDGSLQTSPDGTTWTQRVTSALHYTAVASTSSLIVVVVWNGTTTYSTLTSTDGTTYTSHAQAITLSVTALAVSSSLFVCPNGAGGTTVYTSTDGVTWTVRSWGSSSTMLCTSVGYVVGSGHFVAVGSAGGTTEMQSSPDGTTWTRLRTYVSVTQIVPVYTRTAGYAICIAPVADADWVCLNGLSPSAMGFKAVHDATAGTDPQVGFSLSWIGRSSVVLFTSGSDAAFITRFIA